MSVELKEYQIESRFLAAHENSTQITHALWDLVSLWIVILAMAMLHAYLFERNEWSAWLKVPVTVVLWVVIASRQHALLSLMHEAAHRHFLPGKWNDLISDMFCALPFFLVTRLYRETHLIHHRNVNTPEDPDWIRKAWRFPKESVWEFLIFVIYEAAFAVARRISVFALMLHGQFKNRFVFFLQLMLGLAIWVTVISLWVGWKNYLFYWLCPMFFILPILGTVRSVSEHFGLSHLGELQQSRDVHAVWLERALFAPVHLHLHLTHHLFPAVPRYRLKSLQAKLVESDWYREGAKQNSSYLLPIKNSVLSDLISTASEEPGAN